jgi:hypothetical protein
MMEMDKDDTVNGMTHGIMIPTFKNSEGQPVDIFG